MALFQNRRNFILISVFTILADLYVIQQMLGFFDFNIFGVWWNNAYKTDVAIYTLAVIGLLIHIVCTIFLMSHYQFQKGALTVIFLLAYIYSATFIVITESWILMLVILYQLIYMWKFRRQATHISERW